YLELAAGLRRGPHRTRPVARDAAPGHHAMSESGPLHGQVRPEVDSWVVSIHANANDGGLLGSGVVIDNRRVLTCFHVVTCDRWVRGEIFGAFPMADPEPKMRYRAWVGGVDPDQEVAVLKLEGLVPEGVVPARLRCPPPRALEGKKWWAFGF